MTTPTFAAWARLGGSDGAEAQPETIVVTTASNSKLSRKLLAGLAAGLLLASVAFLVLFIEMYRTRLEVERANTSEQVNRLLQVSLENAMLKRDLPGLTDIVRRLGEQPGISSVRIVNPEREVRFASDPAAVGTRLTAAEIGCTGCVNERAENVPASSQLVRLAGGDEVLRSVNPIRNRAECISCHGPASEHPVNGILVVDHDATGLRSDAKRMAAIMSGAGLLVVLLGLSTVWLVLRRQVLKPVAALSSASSALTEGNLSARVDAVDDLDNELGDLCRSFNRMAERIERGVGEIREKEAFLQTLINTVPDGVRVIDENYTVVMANDSYARQAQATLDQLIGLKCHLLHGNETPCAPTLVTCPFHAIKQDGMPLRYIHRHVRSDGSEVYVETTAARLTIASNGDSRSYIIEAIRDIEQQVRFSHEQRLSEIGQLAAGVAHEIYNPLASIRLGLQAVLRRIKANERVDAETQEYLGMVDGEVDNCISVTKRLLDLSQLPSQSLQLVSFSTVVPDVISLLRFEAEHRHVRLEVDIAEQDLRVLATDAELRMLVLNLAQNAFHAMPDGGVLTIKGRHENGLVVMRFQDTGVGIDQVDLPHIFDPFYSRRADGIHGTGLGLTICRSIATRYHGDIGVESMRGRGTTFTLTFPRADESGALA